MQKLASIQKIHNISTHPNPEVERLQVAKVLEWPVVIKKGEYQEGDLVVFIAIDSIVPASNPYFAFLEKQKYKVWSAKFKGAPSQGLVCPLSILINNRPMSHQLEEPIALSVGDDVTTALGIIKYEKPEPLCLEAKGNFPTNLISSTDEDNFLSHPECLEEFRNEPVYLTLKADGSSCTVIHQNAEIRVCSRRLEQKEGSGFWTVVDKLGLPAKLRKLGLPLAIQGEIVGPGIQSNRMGLQERTLKIFNVKNIETGERYTFYQIRDLCQLLDVPMVDLLDIFNFDDSWNLNRLKEIADKVMYSTQPGEGIVLRPVTPKYSHTLGKTLSVKIININYKQ